MKTSELERRLAAVEDELVRLRQRVDVSEKNPNQWVEKIAGSFSSPGDQAAFDQAMRLGRKWRQRQNRKAAGIRKSIRK